VTDEEYPVWRAVGRARNLTDAKRVLLAEDNLETLCSEARSYVGCLSTALETAPEECDEEYRSQLLTNEYLDNIDDFLGEICNDYVLETIRSKLDCILNEVLLKDMHKCQVPNFDKDCSNLGPDARYSGEIGECYEEKYRRNCDADEVVSCSAEKVEDACDEEAGQLVELIENSLYEKIPICPGEQHLKTLLKYFMK